MVSFEDLEDRNLRALYEYWRGKHRGDHLPSRASVDPLDIPKLLKHIAILEVVDEGEDFVFALAGSRIEEVHGHALKGVTLSRLRDELEVTPDMQQYVDCVRSRRPQYLEGNLKEVGKAYWSCRRLILPLSSDGQRIDTLLMGATFSSAGEPG